MSLEIIQQVEAPPIKTKDRSTGIAPKDMAVAFGRMNFGDAVFVPGERTAGLAMAAYLVAVSRGGKAKTFQGERNGVKGFFYSFIPAS